MALVDIGPTHWPATPSGVPTVGNMTLDAADEVAGHIFRVWKAGTVTRVHFRLGAVTTGATVDVRLETVGTDGNPTGTLFGANTNVAHVIADTDDNLWVRTAALTGSATVAVGDLIAVVIVNPSASFGNLNISRGSASAVFTGGAPYNVTPNRTTKLAGAPLCALEFNDGSFLVPLHCLPIFTASTQITMNTGTNPDETASYLTVPHKCRVIGWYGIIVMSDGANYRVSLYANGNNTPILTKDYFGGEFAAGAATGVEEPFGSALTLDPGVYRLGFMPLAATPNVGIRYWEVAAAHPTLLDSLSGRSGVHYSSRNRSGTTDPDAAAWTEITNRRLMLGLLIDQIDSGAGGTNRAALPSGLSALG